MKRTDQKLIAALRRDGRASISTLAAELGLSRATVRTRIDKLVGAGEILGFTAVLRGDAQDLPVRGMMLIEIEGKGTDRIVSLLNGISAVQTIHSTNGRWDLLIELGTETLAELDAVLRRIRLIDGVANSETNLYLATKRATRLHGSPEWETPGG
jgi:DNA-binding Lrp family transcriptional regulator